MTSKLDNKVIDYLQDMYAAERAQVGQLDTLADTSHFAQLTQALERHRIQTKNHAKLLGERLQELDSSGSLRKVAQTMSSAAATRMLDVVRTHQTAKSLRDAYIAEAMEIISYRLLAELARQDSDLDTEDLAGNLEADEQQMLERLDKWWQKAVHASVQETMESREESNRQVVMTEMVEDYLQVLHALEKNAVIMMQSVISTIKDEELCDRISTMQEQTNEQADHVAELLAERGSSQSVLRRAQGLIFAAVKAPLNMVRSDKAGKDARDLYMVLSMKIAGYELMAALAREASDQALTNICVRYAQRERAHAQWLLNEVPVFLTENLLVEDLVTASDIK